MVRITEVSCTREQGRKGRSLHKPSRSIWWNLNWALRTMVMQPYQSRCYGWVSHNAGNSQHDTQMQYPTTASGERLCGESRLRGRRKDALRCLSEDTAGYCCLEVA